MIGYAALYGAALGGYAGLGPWVIGVIACALAALSYSEYGHLHEQAAARGLAEVSRSTLIQSIAHALVASAIAYIAGLVFRLL